LSGGLFANVKINQRINESNLFDEVFIHQAMGDSGLAVGAAINKALELGEITKPFKQDNVYLGESFSKEAWLQELSRHQDVEMSIFSPSKVANLINGGAIVGIFMGRTEYGPRALGNRSIVVRPTDPETHKKLNERLKRTEIMPFAPSVLSEYADQIFHCDKSKYSAEFMTLCFNTRKEWLNKIPAVVHRIDGTSRPHIVKKSANPIYHSIIEEYRKLSGFPIVLNTSFNAHGEPINNYPYQVLKHLKDGSVDCIATEDFILYKKK
jgi:carbamoyltransferase